MSTSRRSSHALVMLKVEASNLCHPETFIFVLECRFSQTNSIFGREAIMKSTRDIAYREDCSNRRTNHLSWKLKALYRHRWKLCYSKLCRSDPAYKIACLQDCPSFGGQDCPATSYKMKLPSLVYWCGLQGEIIKIKRNVVIMEETNTLKIFGVPTLKKITGVSSILQFAYLVAGTARFD